MSPRPSPNVLAAFSRRGLAIRNLVRLPGQGHSAVIRATLADGRVIKLRAFPTVAHAARVEACLTVAPAGLLPAPLARAGRWLATEFIEGVRVAQHWRTARHLRPRHLAACGRMLARLHQSPAPALTPTSMTVYSRVLSQATRRLTRKGLISQAEANRLRELSRPARSQVALAHGDPGPDNLVVTPTGRLRLIDEERVAVRPLAYDLARAICQWPMDAEEEGRFLTAYERAGGTAGPFLEFRAFWIASALSTRVVFRLRHRAHGIGPVVSALRAVARGPSQSPPGRSRRR